MDGGCFESIKPLLDKNLLPNFKKVIERGFSSKLEVTIPHQTIPSWPCLFSGLSVEQLGFYTFVQPSKGIFNSHVWKDKSILSTKDLKVFALNIPGTYPAWEINGEMLTGILSPELSCFPKELELEFKRNWIVEGNNLHQIFKAFEMKKNLFLKKMDNDFDLMIFVIRVPDAISHRVIGDEQKILDLMNEGYRKIDGFLGQILNKNNIDNIIIFSDHGLKYYNKVFHLPRLLEKKKILYLNNIGGNKWNSIILKLYDLFRPLLKINIVKPIYKRLALSQKRESNFKAGRKLKFYNEEDPQTFIQKLTSNMGAIFLFGKDKDKKDIIKKILEAEKIVDQIIESEKEGFPDLFIILKNDFILSNEPSLFLKRKTEAYSHTNRGLFIAYGKDIKPSKAELISYQEVAPTILKLCRVVKPLYMEKNALDILKNR